MRLGWPAGSIPSRSEPSDKPAKIQAHVLSQPARVRSRQPAVTRFWRPGAVSPIWFVDLAPLANPELLAGVVARALDVPEKAAATIADTLAECLRSRHLLLILDNCEHLIEASAPLAASLLRAAPMLWILATSREARGIGCWRRSDSTHRTGWSSQATRLRCVMRTSPTMRSVRTAAAACRFGYPDAMTLAEALARAAALLDGGPPPVGQRDHRWPAVARLAAFIDDEPDAIWGFVEHWGNDPDAQVRTAIATCLLEQLLDKHFARCFPHVESAVRRSPQFADTFLLCWPFGEASQDANVRRFEALKQEAGAR